MHNYCTPHIIKKNSENFLIHRCNYILLSNCIVYDKLLKSQKSFLITLYILLQPSREHSSHSQKIWGFHSNTAEGSGLLGCDSRLVVMWFPAYQRTMMPSASRVKHSRQKHDSSKVLEPLTFEALGITSLLSIGIHTTWHHIPKDLDSQPSHSWTWKPKSHKLDPVQARIHPLHYHVQTRSGYQVML